MTYNPVKQREYQARYDAKPGNKARRAAYRKKWTKEDRAANPEKWIERQLRQTLKAYNLSLEEYQTLLQSQDGVCAICKKEETETRYGKKMRLSVDHDHTCCSESCESCGKCVRGLLCSKCNQSLHQVETESGWIAATASYLQRIK